ncbi:MAG TPA: formate dehydrogenase accessory sulfurtransferase FdhD [Puia sp.]|nr:formate dehydrogenase accessory sulfurtransferase FdhD [Puia sp.]
MNSSVQRPGIKITGDRVHSAQDLLAVEEPLEIRIAYGPTGCRRVTNLAVTMRTPGQDAELALGFLFTEGIITRPSEIQDIRHVFVGCEERRENVILISLTEDVNPNLGKAERNFYTTSSCGVCGKASIDAIRTIGPGLGRTPADIGRAPGDVGNVGSGCRIAPDLILKLPATLSVAQEIFAETGGLHAAALFDDNGELFLVREDVGRHNALDKLIGASIASGRRSFDPSILLLSGRASFELVQKAAMTGIPVIAAVGAPSSLAVALAEEFGITLIGFLRPKRLNIYSAPQRIQLPVYETAH